MILAPESSESRTFLDIFFTGIGLLASMIIPSTPMLDDLFVVGMTEVNRRIYLAPQMTINR
jgi:hypothetical protein